MIRLIAVVFVVVIAACQAATSAPAPSASAPKASPASPSSSSSSDVFSQVLVVNFGGEEVGTMSSIDSTAGSDIVLQRTADMTLHRGDTVARLATSTVVRLGKDGAPKSYRFEKKDPGGSLVTDAVIKDKTLHLTSTQNGATVKNTVALPDGVTFAIALEYEVRKQLKDGVKIERQVVLEELGAVTPMTVAVKSEGDGFVITASFSGITTEEHVDARGRTITSRTPAVGLVSYPWGKPPPDVAALLKEGKKADLLAVSTWKTKAVPLSATRVVYRINTGDAQTFAVPEDARQKVLARTGAYVDIEVTNAPSTTTPLVGDARKRALSATPYEAIDDPRIIAAAKKATAGAANDNDKVKMLAAFVYGHVEKKGLDRGYAPAIATLESKAGDCTEHSVLMSALLRASGLPTRIVDGVVVDHQSAGYHEWVEVDLGQGFIPVDPTFNAWPAGPQRVKLAEGSTLPDEHLTLSLAAARLLKHGVVVEVLSVE